MAVAEAPKPRVFLSYRRDDTAFETTAVHRELCAQLGHENVFMDVDTITAGHDFRTVMQQAAGECNVMIVLIGRNWLADAGGSGRRIDQDGDYVRMELETALERGIPLIPLLIGSTPMPSPSQLPPSLVELSYRHAVSVRPGRDFAQDLAHLVNHIHRAAAEAERVKARMAEEAKEQAHRLEEAQAKARPLEAPTAAPVSPIASPVDKMEASVPTPGAAHVVAAPQPVVSRADLPLAPDWSRWQRRELLLRAVMLIVVVGMLRTIAEGAYIFVMTEQMLESSQRTEAGILLAWQESAESPVAAPPMFDAASSPANEWLSKQNLRAIFAALISGLAWGFIAAVLMMLAGNVSAAAFVVARVVGFGLICASGYLLYDRVVFEQALTEMAFYGLVSGAVFGGGFVLASILIRSLPLGIDSVIVFGAAFMAYAVLVKQFPWAPTSAGLLALDSLMVAGYTVIASAIAFPESYAQPEA